MKVLIFVGLFAVAFAAPQPEEVVEGEVAIQEAQDEVAIQEAQGSWPAGQDDYAYFGVDYGMRCSSSCNCRRVCIPWNPCPCKCPPRCPPPGTTTTTTTNGPEADYPYCANGADLLPLPNTGYIPHCCSNGANNTFCCLSALNDQDLNEWNRNDPKVIRQRRNPWCCGNGAFNEYCCLNGARNPECSVDDTTTENGGVGETTPNDCPTPCIPCMPCQIWWMCPPCNNGCSGNSGCNRGCSGGGCNSGCSGGGCNSGCSGGNCNSGANIRTEVNQAPVRPRWPLPPPTPEKDNSKDQWEVDEWRVNPRDRDQPRHPW